MVFRLLIAAIAIMLAIMLIKRLRRGKQINSEKKPPSFETMVSCKSCGLRLPKSEAIEKNGEYFCCREHSEQ